MNPIDTYFFFVYFMTVTDDFMGVLKCGCNRISLSHKMSSRRNIKDRDV